MAKFIVFEGIDGSGTTTQSQLLSKNLQPSTWGYEPTDMEIGKLIRKILQDKQEVNPITLLQLFLADRVEHQKVINQCLNDKQHIIVDRYILSTLAYQGMYFELDDLYGLNERFKMPDITFFIDIEPKIGLERKAKDGKLELFEKIETLEKVRANYLQALSFLKNKGWKIILLDGKDSVESIHNQVLTAMEGLKNEE